MRLLIMLLLLAGCGPYYYVSPVKDYTDNLYFRCSSNWETFKICKTFDECFEYCKSKY